ncbi:MAG: CRISPR-associated endonuclease Cas1 [Rhodospirillales bacterium]|nr:CRISPR-associated endonuclease Cas1 [Rhodospirillales bacterium]
MRLAVRHGSLEVWNGFTHYPQQQETFRFFPGQPDVPSRIVLLDGSGSITLDVLAWLAQQSIPLIQLDYRGEVRAAIGSSGLGADPRLLALQVRAASDPVKAMAIATWFVRAKLLASATTLKSCVAPSESRTAAFGQIAGALDRLSTSWTGSKEALLGIEGRCAHAYFGTWRGSPIRWKGTGRKPIPPSWSVIGPRYSRSTQSSRAALHPAQSMFNYAYAVLESQIRIELAAVGLDPATGFLHQNLSDRPALILDLMEPLRPAVDAIVLHLLTSETFHPADFTIGRDGTCRLHPALARRVVREAQSVPATSAALSGLMTQIGHHIPVARQHRSRAWLAQRDADRLRREILMTQ